MMVHGKRGRHMERLGLGQSMPSSSLLSNKQKAKKHTVKSQNQRMGGS